VSDKQNLTRSADFEAVYRGGRAWRHPLLVLRTLPNGLDRSRSGFPVSRRVGKAVLRNLVKRRLREIVRHAPLRSGWDLVVIARPPAAEADYRALEEALSGLFRRAGLLVEEHEEICPGAD